MDGMLEAQGILETEILAKKSGKTSTAQIHADSPIKFTMLTKSSDLLGTGGDIFELGLSQALGTAKKVRFDHRNWIREDITIYQYLSKKLNCTGI